MKTTKTQRLYSYDLSADERDVLVAILQNVGGAPTGPRQFADSARAKLVAGLGPDRASELSDAIVLEGSVYLRDERRRFCTECGHSLEGEE